MRYNIQSVLKGKHGADAQRPWIFSVPHPFAAVFTLNFHTVGSVVGHAHERRFPTIQAIEELVDIAEAQPAVWWEDLHGKGQGWVAAVEHFQEVHASAEVRVGFKPVTLPAPSP